MIALIDADELAYRASFAQEREIDWNDDGNVTVVSELAEALRTAMAMIENWTKGARADRPVLCFSPNDRSNFRNLVLPSYKGHRSTEKPDVYWQLIDALKERYKWKCEQGLEADDLMGLYATHPKVTATVCSQDKDMETLPVYWYNPRIDRVTKTSPQAADRFWMFQTLAGDSADGYKGCPKVGPVKATAALKDSRTLPAMWSAVVEMYSKAKLSAEDALVQARCARILRHGDYNFETSTVSLWRPSGVDMLNLKEKLNVE